MDNKHVTEEHALPESEARFRRLADAAPVLIWISGRDKRYRWFNRQWLEFSGRSLDEECGTGWLDRLHPEDRERHQSIYRASFDARLPFSLEYRLRRHDGEYRWLLDNGMPQYDADGRFDGYIGTCIDLTERKQAEAAQQQVFALVESSDELIAMCDLALRPYYANAAGLQRLGLQSMEEVEAQDLRVPDFFFPEDRNFIEHEFLPQVLRQGQGDVEIRFRHFGGGEAVWMIYSVVVLIDENGKPQGFGTVSRDITERRRGEQALRQADRRKDEFLATLAHELRNPLAPIRNSLEILKQVGGEDELLKKSRDTIERQLLHLVRLVDDLLDVSRITRDKLELRKSRVDLKAVIQQALETVRPLIAERGHRLDLALPGQGLFLHADPVRLTQVFGNLLNNACKFMDPGGRITVRVDTTDHEARIGVRDEGAGIAQEQIDTIFDMFSQIDTTLDRSPGGLGIGLTLVKRLVELHGGRIQVRSEGPGKGSEFVVHLPLLDTQAAAPTTEQPPLGDQQSRRILVVDDNGDNARSLAMLLELQGHRTALAYDGLEAIARAEDFRPEVILLDLGLPRLDGFETCRHLRGQDWGRDILIVALTGWGQDQDRLRSREAGFDDHLVKPVDHRALSVLLAGQRGSGP